MKSGFSLNLKIVVLLCVSCVGLPAPKSKAEDWPQFNGPTRDGRLHDAKWPITINRESIVKNWSHPVAGGYSGPAIANNRVFVTDYVRREGTSTNNAGGRDQLKGTERLLCLDAISGKEVWKVEYDRDYSISYASGPRATPTVDANRVYALGAEGDLLCVRIEDGKKLWHRQLRDEYKTETPIWGYASHPIILKDRLITLAGGKGTTVVALNKMTGEEIWRTGEASNIGYAPPVVIDSNGTKQLIVWDADQLNSIDETNGKILWTVPLKPRFEMSIMAPVASNNKLYASGIGAISAMYDIEKGGKGLTQLWQGAPKNSVYCSNSTPVFDGEYLYGNDCENGTLICVRASDGKRVWESAEPTTGSSKPGRHATVFINKVGSVYYLFSETGDFIVAQLSPTGYKELGRFHSIEPTNECFGRKVVWSMPAYADGNLVVRNDEEIVSYRLK